MYVVLVFEWICFIETNQENKLHCINVYTLVYFHLSFILFNRAYILYNFRSTDCLQNDTHTVLVTVNIAEKEICRCFLKSYKLTKDCFDPI